MKLNDRKSRFTREAPKLDKYDWAVNLTNLTFFVVDCIAVRRFSLEGKYISAAVFAILGLWFLKNELLYGRMMK